MYSFVKEICTIDVEHRKRVTNDIYGYLTFNFIRISLKQ